MSFRLDGKTLRQLRRLSHVPRWTIVPTIQQQSVAEHSYHVTWIAMWVASRLNVPITANMLVIALSHDADEAVTGDIPSPYKTNSAPKERSVEELVVKIADSLEAAVFVAEEAALGNRGLWNVRVDIDDKAGRAVEELLSKIGVLKNANGSAIFKEMRADLEDIVHISRHPGMEA